MGKLRSVVLVGLVVTNLSAFAKPRHPNLASLDKNSLALLLTSMRWGDEFWDPQTKFLRAPDAAGTHGQTHLLVRESSWYALGLLLRDQPGDRTRAGQILRAVLQQQYNQPGKPWDGTFRRSPEEPEPGWSAEMWRAYDPNWREFIGTTFAVS